MKKKRQEEEEEREKRKKERVPSGLEITRLEKIKRKNKKKIRITRLEKKDKKNEKRRRRTRIRRSEKKTDRGKSKFSPAIPSYLSVCPWSSTKAKKSKLPPFKAKTPQLPHQHRPPLTHMDTLTRLLCKYGAKPPPDIQAAQAALQSLHARHVGDALVVVAQTLQRTAALDHFALLELVVLEGVVGRGAEHQEQEGDGEGPEVGCGRGWRRARRAEERGVEVVPGSCAEGGGARVDGCAGEREEGRGEVRVYGFRGLW